MAALLDETVDAHSEKGRRKPHRPPEAESNRTDAELASQLVSVIQRAEHLAALSCCTADCKGGVESPFRREPLRLWTDAPRSRETFEKKLREKKKTHRMAREKNNRR
jgi:hypothetical protein